MGEQGLLPCSDGAFILVSVSGIPWVSSPRDWLSPGRIGEEALVFFTATGIILYTFPDNNRFC